MPTETVYGLAADAQNADAVAAVFAAKSRPSFDPLIVHVAGDDPERATVDVADLQTFNSAAKERYVNLARRFWPGPLTIVLPRSPKVQDLITAGLPTVAVRVPDHPVAQALLAAFSGPLVAPSANRFGRISPTEAAHVVAELQGRIGAVIDGGPCTVGVESTIVRIDPDGAIGFLRPGGLPLDQLEDVVGPIYDARASGRIEAPGQVTSHYAPATGAILLPDRLESLSDDTVRGLAGPGAVGILRVVGREGAAAERLRGLGVHVVIARSLSPAGDLAEAAKRLFAVMRELDEAGAERLLLEPSPSDEGLGHAIADRLRRASARATTHGTMRSA